MMKIQGDWILREIAGEHILVPVGATALQVKGMISLTESGALLWAKLREERTEDELVQAVLDEYDVDRVTAAADVTAFLDQLRTLDLL